MRKILNLRKGEAGQALLFVAIALGLCAIVISATLGLSYTGHRSTEIQKDEMQRYYAADTGLQEALRVIGSSEGQWPITQTPQPLLERVNGYEVSYTIQQPVYDPEEDVYVYRVTSTASRENEPATRVNTTLSMRALTIRCTAGGTVFTLGGNVTGPGEKVFHYPKDTSVDLLAASIVDYNFVNWTGDVNDPNSAFTYIVMDKNYTIQANFEEEGDDYWLLIQVDPPGAGTTTPAPNTYQWYDEGTPVTLTAIPENCRQFKEWTGDVNTGTNPTTITMDGNYTVTAKFTQKLYELTLSANPPAGGSVSAVSGTYVCGIPVAISATPASGYEFVNWTGGPVVNPSLLTTTITMNDNYSIVANFRSNAVCYPCFDYAIAVLGSSDTAFDNSGNVDGDIYVSYDAGLVNTFFVDGTLYVDGDLVVRNTMDIDGNVHVNGSLISNNQTQISGNVYAAGSITFTNKGTIGGSAYAEGNIDLSNKSSIKGDAYAEGSITAGTGAIEGDRHPYTPVTLPPFPNLEPPTLGDIAAQALAFKTEALAGGTTTSMTISGGTAANPVILSAKYIDGSLTISGGSYVKIVGTVYVKNGITIGNNANIKFENNPDPDKRYALVAEGSITMNNGVIVDALGELPIIMSVNAGISAAGSSGTISGTDYNLEAVLYAPNGEISLANKVKLFGSVVGEEVSIQGGATITYAEDDLGGGEGLPACGC